MAHGPIPPLSSVPFSSVSKPQIFFDVLLIAVGAAGHLHHAPACSVVAGNDDISHSWLGRKSAISVEGGYHLQVAGFGMVFPQISSIVSVLLTTLSLFPCR